MAKRLTIIYRVLPDGGDQVAIGRDGWMLRELVRCGKRGLTTLENPAPRISHYIFKLRRAGLVISSEREGHDGMFSGSHSRYRLETDVAIISDSSKAEGASA